MSNCEKCGGMGVSCLCGVAAGCSAVTIGVKDALTPGRIDGVEKLLVLANSVFLSHTHSAVTASLNSLGALYSFRDAHKKIHKKHGAAITRFKEAKDTSLWDRARMSTATGMGHKAIFGFALLAYIVFMVSTALSESSGERYAPGDLFDSTGAPLVGDVSKFVCKPPSSGTDYGVLIPEVVLSLLIYMVNQLMIPYSARVVGEVAPAPATPGSPEPGSPEPGSPEPGSPEPGLPEPQQPQQAPEQSRSPSPIHGAGLDLEAGSDRSQSRRQGFLDVDPHIVVRVSPAAVAPAPTHADTALAFGAGNRRRMGRSAAAATPEGKAGVADNEF